MKKIFTALFTLLMSSYTFAQLNVELLHQLVAHSKEEYDLQLTARNNQALNAANQEINTDQSSRYKERYRDLTQRFTVISAALQVLNSSVESAALVQQIIDEHKRIIELISADPKYLPLVIPVEKEIFDKAKLLARYILGLMLSASELNYMKQSDRRVLYEHVIHELREILSASKGLSKSLYYSALLKKLTAKPLDFYHKDKEIAERILNSIKEDKK